MVTFGIWLSSPVFFLGDILSFFVFFFISNPINFSNRLSETLRTTDNGYGGNTKKKGEMPEFFAVLKRAHTLSPPPRNPNLEHHETEMCVMILAGF